MSSAEEVKQEAYRRGADLVGIIPLERFTTENDPRQFLSNAKSVIVVGHKILRGALRGIEEGTNFDSTYTAFGFWWIEQQFLSKTIYDIAVWLEERGASAIPVQSHKTEECQNMLDCKALAVSAGIGVIGKGGFFLTDKYGHRQRMAAIITDMELEGDHPCYVDFCGDCTSCADACPLHAMSEMENGGFEVNEEKCKKCRNGVGSVRGVQKGCDRFAAACGRACLIALEDKVSNKFENKFRKRSVWSIGEDGGKELKKILIGGVFKRQEEK